MKNLFNSLIVLFLALSYTIAELVPNCSHVLQFSDEEVEFLQKIVTKYEDETYKIYFKEELDPSVLEKYPPHDLSKSRNSSIEIHLDKETILDLFRRFEVHAEDGGEFSWTYPFFAYVLFLAWYEKLVFPPIEQCHHDYYGAIILSLRSIAYYWNPKNYKAEFFRYNKEIKNQYSPNLEEIGNIFAPIESIQATNDQKSKKSTQQRKNCSLQ